MIPPGLIETSAAERDVMASVDRYGWVRSLDGDTIAEMVERGLLYGDKTGHKLTSVGDQVWQGVRVEWSSLPMAFGYEPITLPDLEGCEFHGGRAEHRHAPGHHDCRHTPVRCGGCGRSFCRTPSESHAIDAGLPVINLSVHDVLGTLGGGTRIVTLLDGTEALLRLATPEEFMASQHAAVDRYADGDEDDDRKIGRGQAVGMVTPVDIKRLLHR